MWFLSALSWCATAVQICFVTLALAAALYYLAELIEEYPVRTEMVIRTAVYASIIGYVGLWAFESFPVLLVLCGIAAQLVHLILLQAFPSFHLSLPSVSTVLLFFWNNYLAIQYFSNSFTATLSDGSGYNYATHATVYSFPETFAYFTLCLWLVPLALFLSLSANDHMLPTLSTQSTQQPTFANSISAPHSQRRSAKRSGVLSFFDYVKANYLPELSGRQHKHY